MIILRALALAAALLAALLASSGSAHAAKFDDQMVSILALYDAIEGTLARDHFDPGVTQAAQRLAREARALDPSTASGPHRAHTASLPDDLAAGAEQVAAAGDLATARQALKSLSAPVVKWAQLNPQPDHQVLYCSMAEASWIQTGEGVQNPYYGPEMKRCGQTVDAASAH